MHIKVWKALLYLIAPEDEIFYLDFSIVWPKFYIEGNLLSLRLIGTVGCPVFYHPKHS